MVHASDKRQTDGLASSSPDKNNAHSHVKRCILKSAKCFYHETGASTIFCCVSSSPVLYMQTVELFSKDLPLTAGAQEGPLRVLSLRCPPHQTQIRPNPLANRTPTRLALWVEQPSSVVPAARRVVDVEVFGMGRGCRTPRCSTC